MGIIAFIIIGALAGMVAVGAMPHDDAGGPVLAIVVGVVGAVVGGVLGAAAPPFVSPLETFFDFWSWLGAVLGAVVLLVAYHLINQTSAE